MTDLISISDARNILPDLVNKAGEGVSRFLITVNSKPKAVLLGVEELESLEETAEIMAASGAIASINKGFGEAKRGRGVSLTEFKKKHKIT